MLSKHYKGKHDQSNHGHIARHRSQYATVESVTSDRLSDWESLPNTDYKRMQTEFLKDAITGSLPIIGIQKGGKLKAFASYRYDAKDKANKTIYIPQLSASPAKEKGWGTAIMREVANIAIDNKAKIKLISANEDSSLFYKAIGMTTLDNIVFEWDQKQIKAFAKSYDNLAKKALS